MTSKQPELKVYQAGPVTVIGFAGEDPAVLDDMSLADCRARIGELLEEHDCKVLGFDLTGVRLIPSGLLGLLTSLRNRGIEVHLYNPSEDVREVLAVTRLDQLIPIHEVEL